ncbi:MAG: glutathione S-transferase N-terminal domain-containing protein [Acidimicrobiales bacterium]|nr:glutathione S-transferase N-terminal domain-containing protein [Acidimicrobiales bacterium]
MAPYIVHGLTRSYFTRKVTGYLDYTDRPWRLEPCPPSLHPAATEAGWTGGIPVVTAPDGELMWDSTAIIEYLDHSVDEDRRVVPEDPVLRFVAYLLDDFSDEWFYRPAVGSRWSYPANTEPAGWQIAEELSAAIGLPGALVRTNVVANMTASLPDLGVTADNIDVWMSAVLVPWFEALEVHLGDGGYLLGSRPSLADFAVFGANAAHFVGDPYCREIADQHGPAVVGHTHRLMMPQRQQFGGWLDADDIAQSLVDVIAQAGRHYLPWVAQATVAGSASVALADGVIAEIATTPFLDQARGVMLARYVEARSPRLDDLLERAGVLRWFADHVDQATAVPDTSTGARPVQNRPYPVGRAS